MSLSIASAPPIDAAIPALLEAARRAARGGSPRSVMVVHLSGSGEPNPQHARVARAVLAQVADRLDGEVLRMGNGDLVLICRHNAGVPDAIGPDSAGPDGLPAVLDRLFATAAPQAGHLYSNWHLPIDAACLQTYLCSLSSPRAAAAPLRQPATPPADPLGTVSALLDFTEVPELMRRQTAVRIDGGAGTRHLLPCFQEVTVSIALLERRIAAYGQVQSDPFVFRHLAARLDGRMMTALAEQIAGDADAALGPFQDATAVHINLALPGMLSPELEALADMCRARGRGLGVEVSMVEACAEPAQFARGRARLSALGASLILDGVSPAALQLTRPAALEAALLKLDWMPELPRLTGLPRSRLIEAMAAIGPARLVLHRAETEAALAWGLTHGISMFQGRYVDAMLAAERSMACAHAQGCTQRQCGDRAAAVAGAGRLGCRDPGRLEPAQPVRGVRQ